MASEAQKFIEKHGYVRGTQEAKLTSMGYNLADVRKQVGSWGRNMNPGELAEILPQLGPSPIQQQRNTALQNMQDVASQQFAFDPKKFLPGIKQQAEGIYGPQQAQLIAIRQLQQSQYEDTRVTTAKDFDDTLKAEVESINSRGAFFSGGAIEREGDIRDAKLRALNQLGLQASAADFSNLAQQGLLAAEESQFIMEQLYNAESSAYNRWSDNREFSYRAAVQQYQVYADERDFARNVFESDRTYDQAERQFQKTYELTQQKFDMAKEEFNMNMKIKKLSYEESLDQFKSKYANKKYTYGVEDSRARYEEQRGMPSNYGDDISTDLNPWISGANLYTDIDGNQIDLDNATNYFIDYENEGRIINLPQ